MPLSPEEVRQLLLKPTAKPKSASGKTIDTSVRDSKTWFALAHKIFDEDTQETARCANPDCIDPREGKGAVVAKVAGQFMCRYCFFDGWLLVIGGQDKLNV
jgi:aspartate carbamoyltransferase regulatory subunit